ncbi:uncharacterized protein LOC129939651 isoform X2 [Eupeodes corollae]|uniref:uncharacterized protein LOC129939651 isoform X2 n=1 Tax=Eupeodes corollae TaxID=290404 RepID=UPI002493CE68|nr:uncharacterized protein LOC129939651 isoform X2 [Eupeodes corollae]
MDNYGDMLVEDLIECDVEETDGSTHAVWTEQALDLFMSQLHNVNRHAFSSESEMLQVVTNKMAHRNFNFTLEQIEHKFNSLRKMYIDKRERKQAVEPELIKLFGDINPTTSSKRPRSEEAQHSPKKSKITIIDDSSNSPQQNNKSDEDITYDENGKIKMIWSTQSNRFFLDLLEEHRPLLGTKFRTKKQMWEEISRRLKTRGFHLTWSQVENKWKYLVRHYRSRLEMLRNNENTASNKSAFPELFKASSKSPKQPQPPAPRRSKQDDLKISFANDQKLPFDDDDDDEDEDNDGLEENPFHFEEACPVPEVDITSANNFDPVQIDVKPTPTELDSSDSTFSKLDKIVKELNNFRKDSRKYQLDSLAIKKQELEAYKERTEQFSKIGETLNELLAHMRSRDGHF